MTLQKKLKNNTALFSLVILAGCAGAKPLEKLPEGREQVRKENFGQLFGSEALVFGKSNPSYSLEGGAMGMSANPYIWRAALETVSFMPLASADSVGGVIVTDWYSSATSKSERLKLTIYITDRQLRADAIKVTIHKEALRDGAWVAATSDPATARQLEDIILSKARDLKIQKTKTVAA